MECSIDWPGDDKRDSGISLKSDRKTTSGSDHEVPVIDFKGQEEKLMMQAMIENQVNNRYFNQNAPHLKYRETVVLWLIDTVQKLNYKKVTMYSAVAYFDAINSLSLVNIDQVKLVAFVCLYLAAKLEQKHGEIPVISDCLALFENQFSRKDFETCEALIFKMLKYRLNAVTPFHFLNYFLTKDLILAEECKSINRSDFPTLRQRFARESLELLERSLLNYDFYRYTSLAVAAAVVAATRNRLNMEVSWNKHLEDLTMVSYESIGSCAFSISELFDEHALRSALPRDSASQVGGVSH